VQLLRMLRRITIADNKRERGEGGPSDVGERLSGEFMSSAVVGDSQTGRWLVNHWCVVDGGRYRFLKSWTRKKRGSGKKTVFSSGLWLLSGGRITTPLWLGDQDKGKEKEEKLLKRGTHILINKTKGKT